MSKKYKWCLHCEKVYEYSGTRKSLYTDECPLCGASVFADGWDWSRVRGIHPEYPEIPEHGVSYPLWS